MIIDNRQLEKLIREVERLFGDSDLNIDEQQLVLNKVNARINARIQKQKMSDAVMNVPLGGLFRRAKNTLQGDNE